MWYVARKIETSHFLVASLAWASLCGCSLQILGVNQDSLLSDESASSGSSSSGINAFSVLGATGGSDTTADSLLTDGTTLTTEWVDTSGEDSYEIRVLDSTGSTTLCGPATVAADTTRYTFTSCALSHGAQYRIQVTAKNSSNGAAQSAQSTVQVGPFLSAGNLTVNEWGFATLPVNLSYAMPSSISVQYVTVDGSASGGSDYTHLPLSTLTIPAGQTSALISIPLNYDKTYESIENFRVEFASPSGAALLTSSAQITIQDSDLPIASGFIQVSAGSGHTCGLTSAGAVLCWGTNASGQLGDNSVSSKSVPNPVPALTSGIMQIDVGLNHSCALTSAGGVKCWGDNSFGQIGDNTLNNSLVPTDVIGLGAGSGITQVSAGGHHTCALSSSGAVFCWGMNGSGQVGDNTGVQKETPVAVTGLSSGVAQITTGEYHSCALLSTGAAKCWGNNNNGRLGDNTTTQRWVPTNVFGLSSGVSQISAGIDHTCAVMTSGALYCWGSNVQGRLGDNTTVSKSVPTAVFGLSSGISSVAPARSHTCALTTSGAVKCWGAGFGGQIGDNSYDQKNVPTEVPTLSSGASQLTATDNHSCALISGGEIRCWGGNGPKIGDNHPSPQTIPAEIVGLSSGVTQISAALRHLCALASGGAPKCWGLNTFGRIGDNTQTDRRVPTAPLGLSSGISHVVAGDYHTCAITTTGAVKCWGSNANGQVGDNSLFNRLVPTDVFGLTSGIAQIALGGHFSCALTTSGGVKCWGYNASGALGDNTTSTRLVPTDVYGLSSGISRITTGGYHSCALTTAGGVFCWGMNSYGQIGDNSTTARLIPTAVNSLSSGVIDVQAGAWHTCALLSGGTVKCWGANSYGQLGINSTADQLVPTSVTQLASGITQISAGDDYTCALNSAGGVQCWGENDAGQLGDSTTTSRWVPTEVSGLASGVSQIAAGDYQTCALLSSSSGVICWGSNQNGILGTTYSNVVPQPVRVNP